MTAKDWDKHNQDLALYLEGKLDFKARKSLESSLFHSPELMNELIEMKKDMLYMEKEDLVKTPENLFSQAMEKVKSPVLDKKHGEREKINPGKIALKLFDRCFELIEDSFSLSPLDKEVLSYRGSRYDTEKWTFYGAGYSFCFVIRDEEKIDVRVIIQDKERSGENVELYLKQEGNLRLIGSLKPVEKKVQYSGLKLSRYVIRVMGQDTDIDLYK